MEESWWLPGMDVGWVVARHTVAPHAEINAKGDFVTCQIVNVIPRGVQKTIWIAEVVFGAQLVNIPHPTIWSTVLPVKIAQVANIKTKIIKHRARIA